MPLTTTWTRSSSSECGWALASVTRPCVAQRVWPMPVVRRALGERDGAPLGRRALGQRVAQRIEVADRAHGVETALVQDRDARGVIAAVLELLQALEEDLLDGAVPDVADDPAHEEAILDGDAGPPRDVRLPLFAAVRGIGP